MIAADEARRLALSHPKAYEADHHGFASFRVTAKVFATLPDDEHLHVMVDEEEIRALASGRLRSTRSSGGESGSPACESTWTELTPPRSPSCSRTRGVERLPDDSIASKAAPADRFSQDEPHAGHLWTLIADERTTPRRA